MAKFHGSFSGGNDSLCIMTSIEERGDSIDVKTYFIYFNCDDYYSDTFFYGIKDICWCDTEWYQNVAVLKEELSEKMRNLVQQVIGICEDMLEISEGFHLYRDMERDRLELEDYQKIYELCRD